MRVDAVRLLAQAPWTTVEPVLARLLTADPAPEVRLAAVRAAAAHGEPVVGRWLLDDLKTVTPAVRREINSPCSAVPSASRCCLMMSRPTGSPRPISTPAP